MGQRRALRQLTALMKHDIIQVRRVLHRDIIKTSGLHKFSERGKFINYQPWENMNTQNAVAGIVNRILVNAIALNDTHHIQWPDEAVYCLVFKQHTWPCGWDKEVYVEFFSTKETFDAKRELLLEWVRYEDNDLAMRAQVWDWGPVALKEFDRNLEMLPAENEVCFDAVNHDCT